jgi:hypothetical protein
LTRRPRITPLHPVHLGRGQISYRVSGAPVSPRYSRRLAPPSLPAPNRAWAGRLMRPSRAALRAGQATGLQSDRTCPAIWLRHDAGGSLALHDNSKWRPLATLVALTPQELHHEVVGKAAVKFFAAGRASTSC